MMSDIDDLLSLDPSTCAPILGIVADLAQIFVYAAKHAYYGLGQLRLLHEW